MKTLYECRLWVFANIFVQSFSRYLLGSLHTPGITVRIDMGEFNSDEHYIYYCGQESLRRNSHHSQQKSLKCSTWMQSQTRQNDLCSFPRQPFSITVIQVYAPTSNAKEAEVE